MKQTAHSKKLNDVLRSTLAELLMREVQDPRVRDVTISTVQVSADRRVANVYATCDPRHYQKALAGLQSSAKLLRKLAGTQLGWKYTPELRFFIDDSLDYAFRIEADLHEGQHPQSESPNQADE
jgi:ribosome-binding factor A